MLVNSSLAARGLREIRSLRIQIDRVERAFAVEARREGASWREVGELLGVTPQSAWKRYRAVDPCAPRPRAATDEVRELHALWRADASTQDDGV